MEYESISYALLYQENDKPGFSKISTLLSKTYVFNLLLRVVSCGRALERFCS